MARTPEDEFGGQTNASSGQQPTIIQIDGQDIVSLPSADFVQNADILRDGQDLVLEGPGGEVVVIEGYFNADPAPLLQAPSGEALTPQLVESFVQHAGPAQYADAGGMTDESPIGAIQEVTGNATVARTDGSVEPVTIGTVIFEGDVVETDEEGAVNIIFVDETTLAISENAKLAIDEYVFDPSSESGSTDVSVLRGLFVFTSGLIGRDDPDDVHIDTPMGSIGIRGTIIVGNVNTGEITVMEGAIVMRGFSGTELTMANPFDTARFDPATGTVVYEGPSDPEVFIQHFQSLRAVAPGFFSSINTNPDNNQDSNNNNDQNAGDPAGDGNNDPQGTQQSGDQQPTEGQQTDGQQPSGDQTQQQSGDQTTTGDQTTQQQTTTGEQTQQQSGNTSGFTDTTFGGTDAGFGTSSGTTSTTSTTSTTGSTTGGTTTTGTSSSGGGSSSTTTTTTTTTQQQPPPTVTNPPAPDPTADISSTAFAIDEDSVPLDFVGTVSTVNMLAGSLAFTETGLGTGASLFQVNTTTGAITVQTGASFDFETTSLYTYEVQATDGVSTVTKLLTINLNDLDDNAPVSGGSQTAAINEGATVTITTGMLTATDADAVTDATEIVFTVTAIPGNGVTVELSSSALAANGTFTLQDVIDGKVTIAQDGTEFSGAEGFTFKIDDSAGNNGATGQNFSISVTGVNDAPTLTASTPALTAINEDTAAPAGDTVTSLVNGSITDPDSSVNAIAVTNVDDTNGTWEYSTDSGTNWNAVGSVSDTNALLLMPTDMVRFVPNSNYSGSSNFDFKAWDQSTGTAGTKVDTTAGSAFSSTTDTASITINSVNDAPVLDNTGTPSLTAVNENDIDPAGDTVAAMVTDGSITDTDGAPVEYIAIVGADNTNGQWEFSTNGGASWTSISSVSTTNAILLDNTELIRFVPSANYNGGSGNLTYKAWDGTGGYTSGQTAVDTTIGNSFSSATEDASTTVSAVSTFETVWDTTLGAGDTVTLPLVSGGTYNFVVNWGDGTYDTITAWNDPAATHTYAGPATYTVQINGQVDGWQMSSLTAGEAAKLIDITEWGALNLIDVSGGGYFQDATGLTNITATDILDTTGLTNMSNMFNGATNLASVPNMGSWDVSGVTNMGWMFMGASSFDEDISGWNVSNVSDMNSMFFNASSFNQDISGWTTTSLINMNSTFHGATSFNQNLNVNWDVSSVTQMNSTFQGATAFNGDITTWDVSSVTSMSNMFNGATSFNQDISIWGANMASVTNTFGMFQGASTFDQDLSAWDVTGMTSMNNMFTGSGMSTTNIDATLIGWAVQSLQSGVTLDFGGLQYSQVAAAAIAELTGTYSWTVNTGGVASNAGNDNWTASAFDDVLDGGSGTDTIDGGDGDDDITGGASVDTLIGGNGDDLFQLANGDFVATESIDGGAGILDTIQLNDVISIDFTMGVISNVEYLTVAGSTNVDQDVTMTSGMFLNLTSIDLGAGSNDSVTIDIGVSTDFTSGSLPTLNNIETFSIVSTFSGASLTISGAQLDTLLTAGSNIDLGAGSDTLYLASTSTALNALADADFTNVENIYATGAAAGVDMNFSNQTEALYVIGSAYGETITGGTAADIIEGGDGNDTIDGRGGADFIQAGAGDDVIALSGNVANIDNDSIYGGTSGSDTGFDEINFNALTGSTVGLNFKITNSKIDAMNTASSLTLHGYDFEKVVGTDLNDRFDVNNYSGSYTLVLEGMDGDDVFVLDNDNQNIDGGSSTTGDTIWFSGTGTYNFDESNIKDIEKIDLVTSSGDQTLFLDVTNSLLDNTDSQVIDIYLDNGDVVNLNFLDAGYTQAGGSIGAGSTVTYDDGGSRTINVHMAAGWSGSVFTNGIGGGGPMALDLNALNPEDGFHILDNIMQRFGNSISAARDVDGDGYDDVLFVQGTDGEAGDIFLLNGANRDSLGDTTAGAIDAGSPAGFGFTGNLNDVNISAIGDFDGDGDMDFIVAASNADSLTGSGSGNAIIMDAAGNVVTTLKGQASSDMVGKSVAGIGDINQDGYDDILVGAPIAGGTNGQAYVLYGNANPGANTYIAPAKIGTGTYGNQAVTAGSTSITAEYSATLDKVIVGTDNGIQIFTYNPVTHIIGTDFTVTNTVISTATGGSVTTGATNVTAMATVGNYAYVVTSGGQFTRIDISGGSVDTAFNSASANSAVDMTIVGTSAYVLLADDRIAVLNNIDTTIADGGYISDATSPASLAGAISGAEKIFSTGGNVYVMVDNSGASGIYQISPGSAPTAVDSGGIYANAVDVVAFGSLIYVLVDNGGSTRIEVLNAGGGNVGTISPGMVPELAGVTPASIDVRGGQLFVSGDDSGTGTVLSFDLNGMPNHPQFMEQHTQGNLDGNLDILGVGSGSDVSPIVLNGSNQLISIDIVTEGFVIDNGTGFDFLGQNVTAIGDVDLFGQADFAVSAPGSGKVYVILSENLDDGFTFAADAITFDGISVDASNEIPIFALGDVDGDTASDFAIAETGGNGTLHIYHNSTLNALSAGSTYNAASNASAAILGDATHQIMAAGSAGDFNGDGIDDIAIAFQNTGSPDQIDIFVMYGSASMSGAYNFSDLFGDADIAYHMTYTVDPDQDANDFDLVLSSGGDVDGDGFDELVIGMPDLDDGLDADNDDGGAIVVYGRPGGLNDYVFDGILSHWKMDETSGAAVNDSVSGSSNTGGWTDGVNGDVAEETVTGVINDAMSFDGTDDEIITASPSGIAASSDFTISMWVSKNADGTAQYVFSEDGTGGNDIMFGFNGSDNLIFSSNGGGDAVISTNTVTVGDGWTHIAVSYNHTASEIEFYINGALDSTQVFTSSFSPSSSVYIGSNLSSSFFSGYIDDVRVYNVPLDEGPLGYMANNPYDETLDQNPVLGEVTAGADFQTLVGHDMVDTLDDGGRDGTTFRAGAGDDRIRIHDGDASTDAGDDFYAIDGGGGVDVIEVMSGSSLDFSTLLEHEVDGIEEIKLAEGSVGQTLKLSLDSIFTLFEQSDNGEIKITSTSSGDALTLSTGSAGGTMNIANFGALLDADSISWDNTLDGTDGQYVDFVIGGNTLKIEESLFFNNNVSEVV